MTHFSYFTVTLLTLIVTFILLFGDDIFKKDAPLVNYDIIIYNDDGSYRFAKHEPTEKRYELNNGQLITVTPLSEKDLKVQEEQGCIACHEEYRK